MRQRLSKSALLSLRRPGQSARYSGKDTAKVFNKAECPYCSSDLAYFYWLKFDTAGYCPDCNVNWVETDNGAIWKLPTPVEDNPQPITRDCGIKNLEEVIQD